MSIKNTTYFLHIYKGDNFNKYVNKKYKPLKSTYKVLNTISKEKDELIKIIERDGHCNNLIMLETIVNYLRYSDFILTLVDKNVCESSNNCKVYAVLIGTFTNNDIIEIDILCSNMSGGGKILMDECKNILKYMDNTKNSDIRQIYLSSLTEATGFYLKQNFKCDGTCPMVYTEYINKNNVKVSNNTNNNSVYLSNNSNTNNNTNISKNNKFKGASYKVTSKYKNKKKHNFKNTRKNTRKNNI